MKNMLYKEFKTICKMYWFVLIAAPFFILFQEDFASVYIIVMTFFCGSYNFIFNGSTKGISNNDLYYCFLLPVKKKDIVLSKIMFCGISQVIYTAMILIFVFLSEKFANLLYNGSGDIPVLSILCMYFVSYTLFDLIFFSEYYKNADSCLLWIILGGGISAVFIYFLTEFLPSRIFGYIGYLNDMSAVLKLIMIIATGIIYFVGHYLTLMLSTKELEKINL